MDAIYRSQNEINASIEAFPLVINPNNTEVGKQGELQQIIDSLKVSTRELHTIEKRMFELGFRDIKEDWEDICPDPLEMDSELNRMEEFIRNQKAKPK